MALNIKEAESIFISRTSAFVFASIGLILGSVAYFRFKNPVAIPVPVVAKETRDPLEVEREKKLQKVSELLAKNLFKNAEEMLNELIKEAPKNPYVLSSFSLAEKKLGHFENAETYLRQAIEADGGQWTLYHNLGVLLFEKGKPDEALKAFDKALELSPKNNEVFLSQARVQELMGKYTDARLSYGRALESGLDSNESNVIKDRLKKLDVLAYIERGDK